MINNVLLIFGGVSGEHEVSCISAKFIEKTLKEGHFNVIPVYISQKGIWYRQNAVTDKPVPSETEICHLVKNEKPWLESLNGKIDLDFIFPIIHGTTGEDGKLQGLMEFLDIPYAGTGVLSSALCMDKYFSKLVFQQASIPQVNFIKLDRDEWVNNTETVLLNIQTQLPFPVFIKPSNMGSSVGVSRANTKSELKAAVDFALEYDDQILCEQGLNVREIEISILGNYPDYEVSIPGEIIPNHVFYSYEAKYIDQNGAKIVIPADISSDQVREIHSLGKRAFKAVNGDGFARIDFFLDKATQKIYLNEINTLPGFTPISMFPILWENTNLKAPELIKKIVQLGVEKFKKKKSLKTSRSI